MNISKPNIRKNDKRLKAFVQEVAATLQDGKRHQTPGFGTFSTCTRKATKDQAECKIAMFRAAAELRDYASGGPLPNITGPHAEVISIIVEAMQNEQGIEVPALGRMAVVPVPGKKPKLIFHGAKEFNNILTTS